MSDDKDKRYDDFIQKYVKWKAVLEAVKNHCPTSPGDDILRYRFEEYIEELKK